MAGGKLYGEIVWWDFVVKACEWVGDLDWTR